MHSSQENLSVEDDGEEIGEEEISFYDDEEGESYYEDDEKSED